VCDIKACVTPKPQSEYVYKTKKQLEALGTLGDHRPLRDIRFTSCSVTYNTSAEFKLIMIAVRVIVLNC